MDKNIEKFILNSTAKALATLGKNGLNVVPVSSLKVVDYEIWLINYFMDKTVENIKENNKVALVCWNKMFGYQIKGEVEYFENGEKFDEAVIWIKEILPDRIVKGLLVLKPEEIFDIAPTKNTKDFRYE